MNKLFAIGLLASTASYAACPALTGRYLCGEAGKWTFRQTGCSKIAWDIESFPEGDEYFTDGLPHVVSQSSAGNVTNTDSATLTYVGNELRWHYVSEVATNCPGAECSVVVDGTEDYSFALNASQNLLVHLERTDRQGNKYIKSDFACVRSALPVNGQ
ncbi:MAG: hypothetical protein JST16_09860 [Bdellovibrionales bacterium]|nr:hypothetical protein [Bdellovibrionales bacterium]